MRTFLFSVIFFNLGPVFAGPFRAEYKSLQEFKEQNCTLEFFLDPQRCLNAKSAEELTELLTEKRIKACDRKLGEGHADGADGADSLVECSRPYYTKIIEAEGAERISSLNKQTGNLVKRAGKRQKRLADHDEGERKRERAREAGLH
ncbi:MAG: hypothetical protein C5B49_07375 [Bdellovibrio sp.]|nr:MAG: hypothetical protein C5B49_07375 [Bdellovibrio sp.]